MLFHKKFLESKLEDYNFSDKKEYQDIFFKWLKDTRKEEAIQSDFLNDIFGKFLGYETETNKEEYHLDKEKKTQKDGTKVDGVLGYFSLSQKIDDVRVIIELKGKNTQNLDQVEQQAFEYKDKIENVEWVILCNINEIRLYSAHSGGRIAYEKFTLSALSEEKEQRKKLHFLWAKDRLYSKEKENSFTHKLLKESKEQEKEIENKFYKQYSQIRITLWENLQKNSNLSPELLLSKTQKILDRIIFICFAQNNSILPNKTLKQVKEFDWVDKWTSLKSLFNKINEGDYKIPINKINGGLFQNDEDLNHLILSEEQVEKLLQLSEWNFNSELSINILGHIFEQSISDLEQERAKIQNKTYDIKKGKQKKDGIFYTPEYITRYIMEQTLGSWILEKREKLKLYEITKKDFFHIKKKKKLNVQEQQEKQKIQENIKKLKGYVEELKQIKILDPACGSGAFLVQIFDFLDREWKNLQEEITNYFSYLGEENLFSFDWNYKNILQKNIYGVDKNLDSILITRLSLWLKTANKKEPLTTLDDNIKVGDSLIDDEKIAGIYQNENGEKKSLAFHWKEEFPEVFQQGGFDIIIGNPPYGAELKEESKKYLSAVDSLVPDYEIYIYFISKSMKLLKEKGLLYFIIPNTFLSNLFGKKYRKYILAHYSIMSITNLSNDETFSSAKIRTCICGFKKLKLSKYQCNIINYVSEFKLNKQITKEDLMKNVDNLLSFLDTDKDLNKIIKKVKENNKLLEFFDVSQGYIPYDKYRGQTEYIIKNRIYHSDIRIDTSYQIEIKGKNINQYLLNLNNSPNLYVQYGNHLANPRSKKYFTSPRILIREITSERLFSTYTDKEYYNDPSIINIIYKKDNQTINLKYILTIINSSLIGFYHNNSSLKAKKGLFPKILIYDVKNLPIPKIDSEQQKPFIEKADLMIELHQKLHEKNQSFLNTIKADFKNPDKLSQKLQKFYTLDATIFIEELGKLAKKQKTKKFSLQAKKEWTEFFLKEKSPLQELQKKIKKTDQEINNMVYELYDLTKEEIEIVEKG